MSKNIVVTVAMDGKGNVTNASATITPVSSVDVPIDIVVTVAMDDNGNITNTSATTTVVPVPPANVVNVPLSADLTSVLQAAQKGFTYSLMAGTYVIPGPVLIKANNIKILGSNTTIVRNSVPASSSGLVVYGTNVEIGGITFDSNKPLAVAGKTKVSVNAIRCYGAGANIHDCVARNVDDLVFLEATAVGTTITNISSTNELRGDLVYIGGTQNVKINGVTFVGSQNEHGIRVDMNDTGTQNSAGNIAISNCNMTNFDGKETIAVRMCGGGPITISDSTFNSWVRAGQVAGAGSAIPKLTVSNLTIQNCHFTNKAYLQLDQGTVGTVVQNTTFDVYGAYEPIHLQGPNLSVHMIDNVRHVMQTPNSGLLFVSNGLSPTDSVVETGTVVN